MAITKEWLKKASNSQSYSRGKGYYNEVDDLVKKGNTYSAVVYGTEEYEITIVDNPTSNPSATCDCPYDYDGLCKHIVAVGLNIIDGNYETEEDDDVENPSEHLVLSTAYTQIAHDFYESFFLKQNESIRAAFLKQLFASDENLRSKFINYSQPKSSNTTHSEVKDIIANVKERFSKKLDKIISLEPDDFYSKGRGRYYDYYDDEGDGVLDWVEEKIKTIFAPFEIEFKGYITKSQILNATELLIGIYEASLGVEFSDSSMEDYTQADLESMLLEHLENIYEEQEENLEKGIFNKQELKNSIELILNRWAKRKNYQESISFFENYLVYISNSIEIAEWLLPELSNRQLSQNLIYLSLANAETINDIDLWIRLAESKAYEEAPIMQKLLDKYLSINKLSEFHRASVKAFEKFQNPDFTPYLKKHIIESYNTDLYIKVYLKSARQTQSLADFLHVRLLLSKPQENQFVNECKSQYKNLYIELLNHDANYQGILSFIEEYQKASVPSFYSSYMFSSSFDMAKAISYVIDKYPDDIFDIVLAQSKEALSRMKMDRDGYANALKCLKPLKNLPASHKSDLKTWLNSLQERYKSRPAFLDELKKLGL